MMVMPMASRKIKGGPDALAITIKWWAAAGISGNSRPHKRIFLRRVSHHARRVLFNIQNRSRKSHLPGY